jgi:hypothetical protein
MAIPDARQVPSAMDASPAARCPRWRRKARSASRDGGTTISRRTPQVPGEFAGQLVLEAKLLTAVEGVRARVTRGFPGQRRCLERPLPRSGRSSAGIDLGSQGQVPSLPNSSVTWTAIIRSPTARPVPRSRHLWPHMSSASVERVGPERAGAGPTASRRAGSRIGYGVPATAATARRGGLAASPAHPRRPPRLRARCRTT